MYFTALGSVIFVFRRYAHTHRVTKNIKYITNENIKIQVDPNTMRLNISGTRVVCVQLNYMSAVERHAFKYTNIFLEQGMDVVSVDCTPFDVLLPRTGVQRIAYDLLKLMLVNEVTYVLFGLSIGSYLWSEALVHVMARNTLFKPIIDRIVAQIWDSIGDPIATPTGVPYILFPNNKVAFRITQLFYDSWHRFYLKTCYDSVTSHYVRAHGEFLRTACRAPALLLSSEADRIAKLEFIRNVYETWLRSGIKCTWQCWSDSSHVRHYHAHPQHYRTLVQTHLQSYVPELSRL